MPFTPSHAVVALMAPRIPLAVSATAIGAMSPDLPLFFPWVAAYGDTHSALGALTITLPLACGLLLIWQALLRPSAPLLAPHVVARKLPESWLLGPVRRVRARYVQESSAGSSFAVRRLLGDALVVVLFLGLGIASHIVWDAFTHEGRWGVTALPFLAGYWGPLPGFTWLQHLSSVFGVLVLATWGALWLWRSPITREAGQPSWVRTFYWCSLPVALGMSMVFELALSGIPDHGSGEAFLYVTGTRAAGIILLLTACAAVAVQHAIPARGRLVCVGGALLLTGIVLGISVFHHPSSGGVSGFWVDGVWMSALRGLESGFADAGAHALNVIGGGRWSTVLGALLAGYLLLRRRPWAAGLVAVTLLTSLGAVQLTKLLVNRDRPELLTVVVTDASYPSGHVANAITLTLLLAVVFGKRWLLWLAGVWTVVMMAARTWLGVHWLTDVIGGVLIGLGIALLCFAVFEAAVRAENASKLESRHARDASKVAPPETSP